MGSASSPLGTIARRKPICGAASGASHGARKAATGGAKPSCCWKKRTNTFVSNDATSTTKKHASWYKQYDTIYHEDLRVANMVQNHHLAKSISDAGWSAFLAILAFKAASAGKRVVAVNPAFTSQRCSGPGCGAIVQKGLSVRWHAAQSVGRACIATTTLR